MTTTNTTSPPGALYTGSCHCGHTRYTIHLTLPPPTLDLTACIGGTRIYKCNCTICHKAGIFHLRLENSPRDFALLSPLNPTTGGLGDYGIKNGKIRFYFCRECGMRCFSFKGEGEVVDVPRGTVGLEGEGSVQVWRPKMEGWKEDVEGYLSVNAVTLDHGQEGLDLREWSEKGWVAYLDCLDEVGEDRYGRPHVGGMY